MANFDWSQYAIGGATRPDTFTGMNPQFLNALQAMFENAPPDTRANLRVKSGFRSVGRQEELWNAALAKYGSPDIARKWVAPPGRSHHNKGDAADLGYLDPAATKWAHDNAGKFGLQFPLSNEDWHIELAGSRGGSGQPAPAMGAPVQVADHPIAGVPDAPVAAAPAGQPEGEGGLGAVLEAFAPMALGFGAGQGGPVAEFGSGDPMGGVNAAMQGADAARGLSAGLLPDVEKLMALGKRRQMVG